MSRLVRVFMTLSVLFLAAAAEPVVAGAAHEALVQAAQQETGKPKTVCVSQAEPAGRRS